MNQPRVKSSKTKLANFENAFLNSDYSVDFA